MCLYLSLRTSDNPGAWRSAPVHIYQMLPNHCFSIINIYTSIMMLQTSVASINYLYTTLLLLAVQSWSKEEDLRYLACQMWMGWEFCYVSLLSLLACSFKKLLFTEQLSLVTPKTHYPKETVFINWNQWKLNVMMLSIDKGMCRMKTSSKCRPLWEEYAKCLIDHT